MKPYYERGGITIYHGDCREILPELEVDTLVTDPPYGVGKIYGCNFVDTVEACIPLWTWLIEQRKPTCFTFSHTKLFDLPERPQWIGAWVKPFTGGIVWIGASPSWEPVCFYNMPSQSVGRARWDDVFTYNVEGFPFNQGRKIDHPAPRPVDLMRRLITVMPDGVIADPFMGSGATMRAAMDLGRRAFGIERNEAYCEIAANRLRQEVLL